MSTKTVLIIWLQTIRSSLPLKTSVRTETEVSGSPETVDILIFKKLT